jgi:dihydroorotase-like cyclic amidohydrolase
MFKLIRNVEIYGPDYNGKKDILICNDKIIMIADHIDIPSQLTIEDCDMIAKGINKVAAELA